MVPGDSESCRALLSDGGVAADGGDALPPRGCRPLFVVLKGASTIHGRRSRFILTISLINTCTNTSVLRAKTRGVGRALAALGSVVLPCSPLRGDDKKKAHVDRGSFGGRNRIILTGVQTL